MGKFLERFMGLFVEVKDCEGIGSLRLYFNIFLFQTHYCIDLQLRESPTEKCIRQHEKGGVVKPA